MINIGQHYRYLLFAIGLIAFALLSRLPSVADVKVSHAAPPHYTRLDTRYNIPYAVRVSQSAVNNQAEETLSTSIVWRQVPIRPISTTSNGNSTASTPVVTTVESGVAATVTPTPTNFLTPIAVTPSVVAPTATPTATPTFVPTTIARYPIFVPLLVNQGDPLLQNGDFELGNQYWSEYSSLRYRLILEGEELQSVIPHGGEWAAWLGGKNNETSELSQRIKVPPETPVLRYWYRTIADADCGMDIASVLIDDDLFEQLHLCKLADVDWTLRFIDLRQYSGHIITIKFRLDTDRNGRHSNLFLDDIAWVAASEP